MKKLIVILFIIIGFTVNAATYYVAPTTATPAGNDSNSGTILAPWATFSKAHSSVVAGDTVFFRGGIYPTTAIIEITRDGTADDPICFFNYPNENPIIDGIGIPAGNVSGIRFTYCNYFNIKGITVKNIRQTTGTQAKGMYTQYCNNIEFRNCVVHNVEGHGFQCYRSDSIFYYNCDSHHNVDTLHITTPGGTSDGFNSWPEGGVPNAYTLYDHCRSWSNGDDGWDSDNIGLVEFINCWAWDNGKLNGDGNGFKYVTGGTSDFDPIARYLINCVAVYNRQMGFHENTAYVKWQFRTYNCIAYKNANTGFYVPLLTNPTYPDNQNLYRNNIAYANILYQQRSITANNYVHDHNSWDSSPSVTVTDADFISVDTTGISAARQADGSLPNNSCYNNFLHLASSSDLIDKGIDVGLSYAGASPDLGAFEYSDSEAEPVTIYTNSVTVGTTTATTGGNSIDDGGGTIIAKGVAYGSSIYPTITGSHTTDGSGTGNFVSNISGLTPATTYHVRAYATNEYGTGYGADVEFTTNSNAGLAGDFVFSGGLRIYKDGKQVIK